MSLPLGKGLFRAETNILRNGKFSGVIRLILFNEKFSGVIRLHPAGLERKEIELTMVGPEAWFKKAERPNTT